jgi:hypothetical protein
MDVRKVVWLVPPATAAVDAAAEVSNEIGNGCSGCLRSSRGEAETLGALDNECGVVATARSDRVLSDHHCESGAVT